MKHKTIQYLILIYWIFFELLAVIDKIIPDVYPYWVGVDFYTLFVKLFASLGLTNPIFATIALAVISSLEIIVMVLYILAFYNLYKGDDKRSEHIFYKAISLSALIFIFFSLGDQAFGDRSNLLEHGIFFIMLVISWVVFKHDGADENKFDKLSLSGSKDLKIALLSGIILVLIISYSIINFSRKTFPYKSQPVEGKKVATGVYKFDFPFLADKLVLEKTIIAFEQQHPELKIDYLYTAPKELNTKKKTHMILYLFTEKKK